MALKKRGKWWYGDSQADIRDELARVGKLNEYLPTQFGDTVCTCGSHTFQLRMDEEEGVAIRICSKCGVEHPIGDSDEFMDDAEPQPYNCVCGKDVFEITIGLHLYEGSSDVKWLYVGCRCPACGLTGCYGDWKNEFLDYRKFLERI